MVAFGSKEKTKEQKSETRFRYENMPIQIYWKLYHQKMKIFR